MDKKNKVDAVWVLLTASMIIGANLKLVKIAGYPFSLTLTLLPIWCILTFSINDAIKKKDLAFFALVLLIPFINYADVNDWIEFIKSHAQLLLNVFIFLGFCYHRGVRKNEKTILSALKVSQYAIFSLAIVQFVELSYLGTAYFWNPWGVFSAEHVISYESGRVKSFFHEPSHLAGISIFLFWTRSIIEKKIGIINLFVSSAMLLLARSGAGLLIFPIVLAYLYYTRQKWFVALPTIAILMIPVGVVAGLYWEVVSETTKIHQFQNVTTASSAYMRWLLPINIIVDHWSSGRFFGYGLGQIGNQYFRDFDPIIDKLDISESAIANGLLALQIHFGVLFDAFLLYLFLWKYPKYSVDRRALLFINLVGLTAGSFFMIQFFFIRLMLPVAAIKAVEKNKANEKK